MILMYFLFFSLCCELFCHMCLLNLRSAYRAPCCHLSTATKNRIWFQYLCVIPVAVQFFTAWLLRTSSKLLPCEIGRDEWRVVRNVERGNITGMTGKVSHSSAIKSRFYNLCMLRFKLSISSVSVMLCGKAKQALLVGILFYLYNIHSVDNYLH